jgi:hypothetical protein
MRFRSTTWAVVIAGVYAGACGGEAATSSDDPATSCAGPDCAATTSAGGAGGGVMGGGGSAAGGAATCGDEPACGGACCAADEVCALGQACAHAQKPCKTNDDCWFDSYCDQGTCLPYGVPKGHDDDASCKSVVDIGAVVPELQCAWSGPPNGDPHPKHDQVMSTPVVVDFDFDGDPKTLAPSIVFASFTAADGYGMPGVLRVVDGKDCSQQWSFDDPADAVMAPASAAVGDLDGDGRPEIVAAAYDGGLLAFAWNPVSKSFEKRWRSGTCPGKKGPPGAPDHTGGHDKWSGPSIHDLDDDGKAEIIYGATVFGSDGCVLSTSLGFPAYSKGYVPVVADVDEDGKAELVAGNGIWEWDAATSDWKPEAYFQGAASPLGQVAIADMGPFPLASFGGKDMVEVVVVSDGKVRVQTLEGKVVFGPFTIPGGGSGGPPTIADFDGDGRRELATAGGGDYVVFDLDCVDGGDPAKCNGKSVKTGVLWTQPSQDHSSNVTGSSVFDFNADGKAEAVYADECFLRIYDGTTGAVQFSAARSSGTTYENPVIADVDGDYHTEIVSAVNDYAGTLGCPATDPLFPATKFATAHGVVVLRDQHDKWAASRPVWNQHAYAVTNVGDHGEIPKTSQVKANWKDPSLNDFRQNVQGGLEALGQPDLTAGGDVGQVKCKGTVATIQAKVCNRGTLPMVSGTEVTFYQGDEKGPALCTAQIPVALGVAECTVVSCDADLGGKTVDVFVLVDPKSQTDECHEHNNAALYKGVACGKIPQ